MGVLAPRSTHARSMPRNPVCAQILHSAGGALVFLLVRSPCKIFEPYDNHFWDFSYGGSGLITKNSGLPKLLHWLHALRSDQNRNVYGVKLVST